MGLRKFSDLVGEITPEERAEIDAAKDEAALESVAFNLAELRQARKMTQIELAYLLDRSQPAISQMENTDDHLLSTIRAVVESLGGQLELLAVFDGERIPIKVSPKPTVPAGHDEEISALVNERAKKTSKPRDTYKYRFVGPDGNIKHSGITNDLKRREPELRRTYGAGEIQKVGRRTTREVAKEWERSKPTQATRVP